jgi:alpha-beta hydrolase superfamily lysophospholipase
MQGELVFTTTPDHVRLHGIFGRAYGSRRTVSSTGDCDIAILMHGLGGNFYSSRLLFHFANTLQRLGLDTLIVNSRGHDMVNTLSWSGRARSGGAAMERVCDCTHDINGWVQFAVDRGHQQVLLFGHSLGAIKSLYSLAHRPRSEVRSVVGLSATRLSYSRMNESAGSELFGETMRRCEQLVAEGRSDDLIQVPFPFPTWMTPAGYLEKYGPEEAYNWLRFADRIEVPTLLLFGSRELDENPAFEGLREDLAQLSGISSLTIEEIEGADHFYTACFPRVDQRLTEWLTAGV